MVARVLTLARTTLGTLFLNPSSKASCREHREAMVGAGVRFVGVEAAAKVVRAEELAGTHNDSRALL